MSKIKEDKLDRIIKLEKNKFIELVGKIEKDDKNYDITKALAILYTQVLINNNNKKDNRWLEHLSQYKKQDDMCDALLQGYYCVFTKK